MPNAVVTLANKTALAEVALSFSFFFFLYNIGKAKTLKSKSCLRISDPAGEFTIMEECLYS